MSSEQVATAGKRVLRESYDQVPESCSGAPSSGGDERLESEEEQDLTTSRRRMRRRSSVNTALAFQIPSRNLVDFRLVLDVNSSLPQLDLLCSQVDKDTCFFHRARDGSLHLLFRAAKLHARGLLGAWQIYLGHDEPLAMLKQSLMALNPTYFLFRGSDADKGALVYTLVKKLRSQKIRIFEGDSKSVDALSHFCLYGDDRIFVKLKDSKAIGGQGLGDTILDYRQLNGMLRIGRGFDTCLAVACFVLCQVFAGVAYESAAAPLAPALKAAKADPESATYWHKVFVE